MQVRGLILHRASLAIVGVDFLDHVRAYAGDRVITDDPNASARHCKTVSHGRVLHVECRVNSGRDLGRREYKKERG